jgi:hypothetical protein
MRGNIKDRMCKKGSHLGQVKISGTTEGVTERENSKGRGRILGRGKGSRIGYGRKTSSTCRVQYDIRD